MPRELNCWREQIAIPLLASLALIGCGEDVWYQAIKTDTGFTILRADLGNDSCLIIHVEDTPTSTGEDVAVLDGLEVELEHRDEAVAWAVEPTGGADLCTLSYWTELLEIEELPVTEASGRIRFKEVTLDEDGVSACKVKLNAQVAGVRMSTTVPIVAEGCDRPPEKATKIDVLGASSPESRGDVLTFMSWDSELKTCYELTFGANPGTADDPPSLVLPEHWQFQLAAVSLLDDESQCGASNYGDTGPRVRVLGEWESPRGTLTFVKGQPWPWPGETVLEPCRVNVDVSVDFDPKFHWVPHTLRFVDQDLDVAWACGED